MSLGEPRTPFWGVGPLALKQWELQGILRRVTLVFAKINDSSTTCEWKGNKKQLELEQGWWEKERFTFSSVLKCVGGGDVSLDRGMICFIN